MERRVLTMRFVMLEDRRSDNAKVRQMYSKIPHWLILVKHDKLVAVLLENAPSQPVLDPYSEL